MRSVFLAAAALSAIATNALADETLKYRTVYHTTALQSQNAPDTDGHVISVTHASGLASLPDGSVGADNFVGTLDYVKGSGPFVTYGDVTFSDGSVLFLKNVGTTTTEGTKASFKGTITIIGGKGKYDGAKGDGVVTGGRTQPQPGAGAHIYADVTLNIKK
jgi:hypothetical protein